MDKKRIILGLSIAAVIMTAVFFVPAGNPLALLVLLAICGLAMREIYALMALGDMPASKKMGMISGLVFVAMTWWVSRSSEWTDDALWALLLLILIFNFFRLLVDHSDARLAIRNALGTLFGFVYVAFFWSFFVRLYLAGDPAQPVRVAFYLLLAVKWGDAGAYFIGSKFGKHRLAPAISPKKSWEGLFGGILFSCVVGAIWWLLNDGMLGPYTFPFYHTLILGVVLPIIGTLGDLVESLFKRAVDVKDSGAIAHGMGGMLDMIDSLLFTAPFMYIYIQLFLD
ncbi:MAG: phosphatidate cytidylyltransferase [Kiritimatiellales bacterium]|nr:phosphatidate cytidylyltransferase [Kiritimatiellales bacterium]